MVATRSPGVTPDQGPNQGRVPVAYPIAMVFVAGAYLVLVGWSMQNTSFDVWGGLLMAPVLVTISLPAARWVARQEGDPAMARIVIGGLVCKLAGSLVRYAVAFEAYSGTTDAQAYHKAGIDLAPIFRSGIFHVDLESRVIGTGFIKILTGLVYAITGPSKIGGYLVFSWIGFWGLYFFYRAFRMALPEGDHRRYAKLLFFLPSLLFWPSSIGKEAWMTMTLGLCAYGAARMFVRRPGGFLILAIGLMGTIMVRPHVALLMFAAIGTGYMLRPSQGTSAFGPLAKVLGITVLLASSFVLVSQVNDFFGIESFDSTSVDKVLEETSTQTGQGTSEFQAPEARSITQLPQAVISILFRPFPFEANNLQATISSAESTLLLVLFFRARSRLKGVPRMLLRTPYVAFSLMYLLLFAMAFSNFANFGIVVRQRVQVLPMALVLLAVPIRERASAGAPEAVARARV